MRQDARLIDRDDSEPLLERSRTFFYSDEILAAQEHRVITILLSCAAVLGVGLVVMAMAL